MRPTSDQDKRAAGTYTPKRSRSPMGVPVGTPECPLWVSSGARRVWGFIVPDLAKSGILAHIDWFTLGPLCELMAEYQEDPRKFSTGRLKEMRMLAAEMGLSISSRLKMKTPEGVEPPEPDKCKPKQDGNVVSISRLLSGTPKGSSSDQSRPADTSASPASDN